MGTAGRLLALCLSFVSFALLVGCGGGGGAESNEVPVAHAGAAQSVVTPTSVTLNGSASSDADSDSLTYSWIFTSKPAGSAAVLNNPMSVAPTFVADTAGAYVAMLVVNDGKTSSVPATVTITAAVGNAPPVANAGQAQSVVTGATVTLNGGASSDANGDPLTYSWTLTSKPVGSAAVLNNGTLVAPAFGADVAGTYVARLIVSDGQTSSAPATVTVTVAFANATPVANAGPAQTVLSGTAVTLNGNASSDANGDFLTYSWILTSKPEGSGAVLSNAASTMPTFFADKSGSYVVTLTVNDGLISSPPATTTITTMAVGALPLNAGTFWANFLINETTGSFTAQPGTCGGYFAADPAPSGVVFAVSGTASIDGISKVMAVDVLTGACSYLFPVPEPMTAIAVAADGTVVTVSLATSFGAQQIYRFSPEGAVLSKVALSGDLTRANAIDFAPDGSLYAANLSAILKVDPVSGVGILQASNISVIADIDIDSAGILRYVQTGVLYLYSTTTLSQIGSRVLEQDIFAFSPLVRR